MPNMNSRGRQPLLEKVQKEDRVRDILQSRGCNHCMLLVTGEIYLVLSMQEFGCTEMSGYLSVQKTMAENNHSGVRSLKEMVSVKEVDRIIHTLPSPSF